MALVNDLLHGKALCGAECPDRQQVMGLIIRPVCDVCKFSDVTDAVTHSLQPAADSSKAEIDITMMVCCFHFEPSQRGS